MPTKGRGARLHGSGYRVFDNRDGTVTLHGNFAGVYTTLLEQDVAPGGAQTVTLDAATGKVLTVE